MHEDRLVSATDLVLLKDISERTGINPNKLSNLAQGRRNSLGFPRPICGRGGRGIWLWPEVESWWKDYRDATTVVAMEHSSYRPTHRRKKAA